MMLAFRHRETHPWQHTHRELVSHGYRNQGNYTYGYTS